jgi:hypothetical protein
MVTSQHGDRLEHVIAAACGLLSSDAGIGAVYLVTTHRPTYDELLCYRRQAADHGHTLIVSAHGVALRRKATRCRSDAREINHLS